MTPSENLVGLAELADRVEQAVWPQPDGVLNREVARAVGWGYQSPSQAGRKNPAWFHPDDCRNGVPVIDSLHGTDMWREPLGYLGSLDAAMTLVPEGMRWCVDTCGTDRAFSFVEDVNDFSDDAVSHKANAATPALALCAAALRARSAQ